MEIVYKKLNELKPYDKNPRKNDDAVQYVMESIKNFGFKVPIVIDSDGVIVCGHTRFKASRKLKLKEVPCIIADDLTEEQIKAFRLADNKVSEKADWDFDILNDELFNVSIDMEQFGFEPIEINVANDSDEENMISKENERMRTNHVYNMELINNDEVAGKWQMPIIKNNNHIPSRLISFNYALNKGDERSGIHCFVDDYQFERLWNRPHEYIDTLMKYDCFLSPDFSLYADMLLPNMIWNVYRSRLLGQFYQNCGIKVIPTISWCEENSYEFCFDGIPKGSIVAVSTIGIKQDKDAFRIWRNGMNEMIKRIEPKTILVYGGEVDYNYGDVEVIYFDNENTERMKEI